MKFLSTRFSIVSRSKGHSAIGKSSYISREKLYSKYDGQYHFESAKEDLVHKEVSLCANAPDEYKDREKLWNSVEKIEKSEKAQLCRMMKVICLIESTSTQDYQNHIKSLNINEKHLRAICGYYKALNASSNTVVQ